MTSFDIKQMKTSFGLFILPIGTITIFSCSIHTKMLFKVKQKCMQIGMIALIYLYNEIQRTTKHLDCSFLKCGEIKVNHYIIVFSQVFKKIETFMI